MSVTEPLAASRTETVSSTPTRRARVTIVANLKGGVGKTTNSIHLAASLARGLDDPWGASLKPLLAPQKVLFIDFESLCTGSTWLGVKANGYEDSCGFLFEALEEGASAEERESHRQRVLGLVRKAQYEDIDVIPASLRGVQIADGARNESEYTLKENLAHLRPLYDHIVLDTPGQRQERMLRSALIAGDGVIIPVPPEAAVIQSMDPLVKLIAEKRRDQNPGLHLDGVVLSRAGKTNDMDQRQVRMALQKSAAFHTFDQAIRTLKSIQRAPGARCSVFQIEGAEDAAYDFNAFAVEWARHVGLIR